MLVYIIYIIISPFISLLLYFIGLFNYKIRANHFSFYIQLYKIKKQIKSSSEGKSIILFHAASAGEYEQLKPILRLLDKEKYYVVQSFTSPTIFMQVSSSNQLFDIACYHPYDFFWRSWLFFKFINPKQYVVTRHDLWPGHVSIAHFLKIDIYFINANIHKNSIWYKPYFRLLSRWVFNKLTIITVPSQSIKNNLLLINMNPLLIKIINDTRFDQILYRSIHQISKVVLPKHFIDSEIIIFGSIDLNDEKIIFPTFKKLFSSGSRTLKKLSKSIIMVPHEVNDNIINRLKSQLTLHQFQYILLSEIISYKINKLTSMETNIILVDRVGLLAELYKYAQKAYVGGGFSRGVHSVLEPAIYNCSLASGPNIEMLDEAKELVNTNNLKIIKNSTMLSDYLMQADSQNIKTSALFVNNKSSEDIVQLLSCY